MNNNIARHPASFRDNSGFVFFRDGKLFRQINKIYQQHYHYFISSGLYEKLISSGLLVAHKEVDIEPPDTENCFKIIQPDTVPFVTYPYEWCFSQLKKAAMLTLDIAAIALEYGMILKDSSAFNVQFIGTKPVFIDTLSFEIYNEGEPWVAYRQFCEHFLAPLLLMSYGQLELNRMLTQFIDGIPVEIASSLLPFRAQLKPSVYMHIFAHAKAKKSVTASSDRKISVRKNQLHALIDNLKATVSSINLSYSSSIWSNYYKETNYTEAGFKHKQEIVQKFLDIAKPENLVLDIGANTGLFSQISSEKCYTLSVESDPVAAELNYTEALKSFSTSQLTMVIDITNPSPGIGWMNEERYSFLQRANQVDAVLFLAVIHHLAIGNNLPLKEIAYFLYRLTPWCLVEFVPKEDSQVQKMLKTRKDIFRDYNHLSFKKAFEPFFETVLEIPIIDSKRIMYIFKRRKNGI